MCSLGAWLSVPEPSAPRWPSEILLPGLSPSLLVTSLGFASGRWASCELAPLFSQFMARCFTTLFFLCSSFCPFHWLFCDLVVVG